MKLVLCALLSLAAALADEPAPDIVRKALDVENRDFERSKDYTYRQRQVTRESDAAGKVTSTKSLTHDVLILYGRPFRRLVEKDGKPLTESEQRKEEARLQKAIESRKREQNDPDSKERRAYEKQRVEQRKFVNQILDAFDFKVDGVENLGGRPSWIITGAPRPGFKPKDTPGRMLTRLRGRMWIDKATYEWVKVDTEVTDTLSIGLVLARVSKGSWIHVEKKRVNDEVWLPSRVEVALDGRLALLKKLRTNVEITYSGYQKFQTDSKVVATEALR